MITSLVPHDKHPQNYGIARFTAADSTGSELRLDSKPRAPGWRPTQGFSAHQDLMGPELEPHAGPHAPRRVSLTVSLRRLCPHQKKFKK